jgi:hypothetical protein
MAGILTRTESEIQIGVTGPGLDDDVRPGIQDHPKNTETGIAPGLRG